MGTEMNAWIEHAISSIRTAGHRSGGARARIVDLFARQDCLLSAQEVFDSLRAEGRPVGIASVYRVLDVLTELGLVRRIELGEGPSRYEPVALEGEHHHHAVCDDCGKVEAFTDQPLENALSSLSGRLGFDIAGHDVLLRGACEDCRPAA